MSLAVVFFLAASVSAAEQPRTVKVTLPSSLIERVVPNADQREATREKIDLSASSWSPAAFQMSSRISGASTFKETGLPALALSYLTSPVQNKLGRFRLKLGLGFYRMERQAQATALGKTWTDSQNLYLTAAHFGAEALPEALSFGFFSTYFGAAAHPTLLVINDSVMSDDFTGWGMAYELSAGLLARLTSYGPDLRLGVSQTLGRVEQVRMSGTAVQGGVRFSI